MRLPCLAYAQDEEDPEESDYPPGLLATYRAGETEIQRIDPQISFSWNQERPDIRLPSGPFSAEWSGYFLMKAPGEYRFHAYLEGEVEVRLDDRIVLQGKSDEPQWLTGDQHEFSFGDFPIQVTYKKTGDSGTLKLFWSSPQFALEPVSTFLLFRESGSPELASLDHGRLAFQAWRCAHCHDTNQAWPKLSAPSLQFTLGTLDPSWIVSKLTQPASQHDHMPEFSLSEKQAADVASYLLSSSAPTPKIPKQRASSRPQEDAKAGQTLVNSTGCLVCHVVGELGQPGPFGGGELTQIETNDLGTGWLTG